MNDIFIKKILSFFILKKKQKGRALFELETF